MHRLLTLPLRRLGAAATLLASLIAPGAHAALDTHAQTDDHAINVPTAWWTYNNLSPQQLADKVA